MQQYTTIDDIDDVVVSGEGNGGDFEYPPFGDHQAVMCDIQDLGEEEVEYKGQKKMSHKVLLVFQLECEHGDRRKDGTRFTVRRKFTRSLYNSALLDFLIQWRGKAFTADEIKEFRLKTLYGVNASIVYGELPSKTPGGKPYKGIVSISKWNTKLGPTIRPENYVRETYKKKDAKAAAQAAQAPSPKPIDDDDTVPF